MTTFLFPGQGSQVKGMGADLFDKFPDLTKKASDILGYSIKALCTRDAKRRLNKTQFTQPALFVVNALTYQNLMESDGARPNFSAGHSLGEYNALYAAGVMSFEDGLKMVKKRGELMSQAPRGTMAAILGLTIDEVRACLKEGGFSTIDVANINAPTQIVISGPVDDLPKTQSAFESANAMFCPLNVSGAFHSRYMNEIRDEYEQFLKGFKYSSPQFSVIANVTAEPYSSENIVNLLSGQLVSSVRWTDSINYLLERGEQEFLELGPGDVLTKLMDKIKDASSNGNAEKAKSESSQKEKISNVAFNANVVDDSGTKDSATKDSATKDSDTKDNVSSKDTLASELSFSEKLKADLQEQLNEWNSKNPVGTKVNVKGRSDLLSTRSEAILLFGHRTAIYLDGFKGYFALDDISVA